MAISKNTYPATTVIAPFLVKVFKDSATNYIIIVDETPEQARASLDQDVTWILVEADYHVTVLSRAPNSITEVGTHSNLSSSLIKIKGGEVFVTAHSSTPQTNTNQNAVTGYTFGTFDKVYIKVDRIIGSIKVYGETDNV